MSEKVAAHLLRDRVRIRDRVRVRVGLGLGLEGGHAPLGDDLYLDGREILLALLVRLELHHHVLVANHLVSIE